jgi:hypothetical protein
VTAHHQGGTSIPAPFCRKRLVTVECNKKNPLIFSTAGASTNIHQSRVFETLFGWMETYEIGLSLTADSNTCVVLKESELEVILHNLATVKRGGVGMIPILDSYMTASLTHIHHKCACVTSESARLFTEPTCSVVRYYPDTDQSA